MKSSSLHASEARLFRRALRSEPVATSCAALARLPSALLMGQIKVVGVDDPIPVGDAQNSAFNVRIAPGRKGRLMFSRNAGPETDAELEIRINFAVSEARNKLVSRSRSHRFPTHKRSQFTTLRSLFNLSLLTGNCCKSTGSLLAGGCKGGGSDSGQCLRTRLVDTDGLAERAAAETAQRQVAAVAADDGGGGTAV